MRAWVRCLVAVAMVAGAGTCQAQVAEPYPSRPVRIIVPFGAGGPGDLFARLIAQHLTENLGKTFYIENHPGAAGNIGTALAARAQPTAIRWWW
jgi:tripartite-type tricarboxylate transporter receptor subunit TctC